MVKIPLILCEKLINDSGFLLKILIFLKMNHTIKNYDEEKDDVKKLNCLKFYIWAMERNVPR